MTQRRIVIAGTESGVGKTTITIGLMAALKQRGLSVQGFKCGPDYIDPTYHTAVTGRPSRNLDSWMFSHETLKEIFCRGSADADLSIIEGVMGFYDGQNPYNNEGSTAQISQITKSPVILVVSCHSMARSAAAIVKGFQHFSEGIHIADSAFHFYYPENLELLELYGAKLLYFSPLAGETVPEEANGLYIGGGFPEEFAPVLAENELVKVSIRSAIQKGLPTLAECGGYMYLSDQIETTDGKSYSMVGLIPGKVTMQTKLAAFGYREITGHRDNFLLGVNEQAKGHEFHYSIFASDESFPFAYETKGMGSSKKEGFLKGNLCAGYTHFHFASNPILVKRWISKCAEVASVGN